MAYQTNQLLVAVKAFSRANPLPIDSTSVYDSLAEAQSYAQAANAYAGQIITVKEGENYNAYILDGEAGAYTLSKVGIDASEVKNYVQVVTELPSTGQEQGVIYINTTDSKGYIYNGTDFQVIFEDVTDEEGNSLQEQLDAINTELGTKAPINNPTFTGTVTLAADPTGNLEAATKQYVDRLVAGINDFTVGVVDSSTPLPSTDYEVGQTFRVAEAGTYAGQECETGDLIIVIKDYAANGASNADFLVVQANVDGAVTGPDASTDANIVVFDGTTGRKIKDSSVTIASVSDAVAKAHEHANKTQLDSFTKTETELLGEVDSKIATALGDYATTEDLAAYVTTETYETDKAANESRFGTIETNLNTKITATDLANKIGEIGDVTVKDYVDTAVGSGGADVAEQILQAKTEAINTAKTYTDTALTITEF